MKKYLLALLLALSSTAWAYRFPIDSMEVAVLKSASFPQVTLTTDGFSWLRTLTLGWLDDGAKTVDMVQGVRIKDENNRFIPPAICKTTPAASWLCAATGRAIWFEWN